MSEFDVFAWCKENKEAILAARAAGNVTAKTIVTTHDLYVRRPDRIALTLLEQAVEQWQEEQKEPHP